MALKTTYWCEGIVGVHSYAATHINCFMQYMAALGNRAQDSMSTPRGSWLHRERGRWEVSVAHQLVWCPSTRIQVRLSRWMSRMTWSNHGDDPAMSGGCCRDFNSLLGTWHTLDPSRDLHSHCVKANSGVWGVQWCILVAQLIKTQTLQLFFMTMPALFLLRALYFITQPSKEFNSNDAFIVPDIVLELAYPDLVKVSFVLVIKEEREKRKAEFVSLQSWPTPNKEMWLTLWK